LCSGLRPPPTKQRSMAYSAIPPIPPTLLTSRQTREEKNEEGEYNFRRLMNEISNDHVVETAVVEDDREEPSPDMMYLKGRCLRGQRFEENGEPLPDFDRFTAQWIFQRAVNKCVHKLRTLQNKGECAWYFVRVDATVLEQYFPVGFVVFMASVLSPLVFPIIFGCATAALLFPGTWRWLQTYKMKKRCVLMSDRFEDTDEPCFPYWRIQRTLCECICWFVVSTVPWAVIIASSRAKDGSGIHCVLDPECDHMKIHASYLTVASPWLACALAAFQWTHEIHTSACDCACNAAQVALLERDYALKEVTEKLSLKFDKMSFWPIFLGSPDDMKIYDMTIIQIFILSKGSELAFLILALLHGLLPQLYMLLKYSGQGFCDLPQVMVQEAQQHPLEHALIWIGILAPAQYVRCFARRFYLAILDYELVVKQVTLFSCMTSTYTRSNSDETRRNFMTVVLDNDAKRWNLMNSPSQYIEVKACETAGERFPNSDERPRPAFKKSIEAFEDTWHANNKEAAKLPEQLDDLWMYQVAFNMHSREGIDLYRKARTWLITDTIPRGMKIEWGITASLQIMAAALLGLALGFFKQFGVSSAWTVLPIDILALTYLIIRGLNSCVTANQLLSEQVRESLREWVDALVIPDARFHDDHAAWILDGQKPKGLRKLCPVNDTPDRMNFIIHLLESTISRFGSVEARQQFLGMSSTNMQSFRSRALATVVSASLAFITSLIKALSDERARAKLHNALAMDTPSLFDAINHTIFT